MAKITIPDLKDTGFTTEQFPSVTDFDTATTGFLARLIKAVATRIAGRVGTAAYDAVTDATSIGWERLARAELYAACAELWRRRMAYADGNASNASDRSEYLTRREYLAHAAECDALSEAAIAEFLTAADGPATGGMTGLSVGVVETGPFSAVTS